MDNDTALKMVIFGFFFVFVAILFPEMQNRINAVDTSAWTFIGHEGVAALLPALPLIFLVCTLIPFLYVLREGFS